MRSGNDQPSGRTVGGPRREDPRGLRLAMDRCRAEPSPRPSPPADRSASTASGRGERYPRCAGEPRPRSLAGRSVGAGRGRPLSGREPVVSPHGCGPGPLRRPTAPVYGRGAGHRGNPIRRPRRWRRGETPGRAGATPPPCERQPAGFARRQRGHARERCGCPTGRWTRTVPGSPPVRAAGRAWAPSRVVPSGEARRVGPRSRARPTAAARCRTAESPCRPPAASRERRDPCRRPYPSLPRIHRRRHCRH